MNESEFNQLNDDTPDNLQIPSNADETESQIQETVVLNETEENKAAAKPVILMSTLPITGEPRVDDALGRLNDLEGLPVHEHPQVFEDVQRRLHETLADIATQ